MITNKKHNVDLVGLADKNLLCDFATEMNFDVKAMGNKSTRDRTLIILLKSPRFFGFCYWYFRYIVLSI